MANHGLMGERGVAPPPNQPRKWSRPCWLSLKTSPLIIIVFSCLACFRFSFQPIPESKYIAIPGQLLVFTRFWSQAFFPWFRSLDCISLVSRSCLHNPWSMMHFISVLYTHTKQDWVYVVSSQYLVEGRPVFRFLSILPLLSFATSSSSRQAEPPLWCASLG